MTSCHRGIFLGATVYICEESCRQHLCWLQLWHKPVDLLKYFHVLWRISAQTIQDFFFLQLTCWNQITDVAANSPTNDNWVYLWCITVKNHILPDSHCLEVAACWFPEKCLFRLVDSLKIPATSAFNMSKHQILRGGRFVAGTEGMKVFT